MSAPEKRASDIVGLTSKPTISRRGFMTATAAATAGYTLAAGPVRAEVITTDTTGLVAEDGKAKVADGEMPLYFAKPSDRQNPPVILVAMEIFDCTSTSRTSPGGWESSGRLPWRPTITFAGRPR